MRVSKMRAISPKSILSTILNIKNEQQIEIPEDLLAEIIELEAQSVDDRYDMRAQIRRQLDQMVDQYVDHGDQ